MFLMLMISWTGVEILEPSDLKLQQIRRLAKQAERLHLRRGQVYFAQLAADFIREES